MQGRDIICFSNDWDSDPLSKKHIMQRLAKQNRVLWVNSIGNRRPTASVRDLKRVLKKVGDFTKGSKRVAQNIHVYAPIALPFHRSAAARWLNRKLLTWGIRRLCRRLKFDSPVTWTFEPASAEVAGSFGEQVIIYHCVDEFSEFSGAEKEAILQMERQLIRKSNALIASSERLFRNKSGACANSFFVSHGVDLRHFRKACLPGIDLPPDVASLPRPIIGFFGLIADWVDLKLIRFLAEVRPEYSFVLIGKRATDTAILEGVPNVHLLGPKPYEDLPAYSKAFDVALLPFVVNELTLSANPLKVREYLAAGLPVVASALPEVERLRDVLKVARSEQEFLAHIDSTIRNGPKGPQLAISEQMETESWDHKVNEMVRIFAAVEKAVPGRSRAA